MAKTAPNVFISYSHDSPTHKLWVLKLASDLRGNGVDAVLDQWDLSPGQDIAAFMEMGLKSADRVIVVCSNIYVERAEEGKGGVGYEKMIVTAELIPNLGTKKFIPIIRGSGTPPVPAFLGYRLYIDFEDDAKYATSLETLLREIFEVPDPGKPPLGSSPFDGSGEGSALVVKHDFVTTSDTAKQWIELHVPDEASALVGTIKGLISKPSHLMALHDVVVPIALHAKEQVLASSLVKYSEPPTEASFLQRISEADAATNDICQVLAVGGFWASANEAKIFTTALKQITIVPQPQGTFYELWENVIRYPSLRGLYCGGIAAVANESYVMLRRLMVDVKSRERHQDAELPLIRALHTGAGFAQRQWKWLPEQERHYFPVSDYFQETLKGFLNEFVPDDDEYVRAFDRFELLQALTYADFDKRERFWAPLGSFVWRRSGLIEQIESELDTQGVEWAPLQAGFFGGSPDRAKQLLASLKEFVGLVRGQLGIW